MNGVIYARYSSDNQREESIEGQIRECKEYAEKHDIHIINEYIDRARSATTARRPAFQQMIFDAESGGFDAVIVWKIDRFSRNRKDALIYRAALKQNGVDLISIKEDFGEGAARILLEALFDGWAEFYSVDLSEKVTRGHEENALKCKNNGGTKPLGYTVTDDGYYELDPLTAPFVLRAFEMYSTGSNIKHIVDFFRENNVKNTLGREMNIDSVKRMLHNEKYKGNYVYANHNTPDAMPAIVTPQLFDAVQQRLAVCHKTPAQKSPNDEYLLSTKLFCGLCGETMVGESGTSHTKTVHHYYKCTGAKKHSGCTKKTVRKEWIEGIVLDYIKKLIYNDEQLEQIADAIIKFHNNDNKKLNLLNSQLADTEKCINNVLDGIQRGGFSESLNERLGKFEAAKKDLVVQIAKEKAAAVILSKDEILSWLKDLRNLDDDSLPNKRKLIYIFINKIVLYDDKIIITFNFRNHSRTIKYKTLLSSAGITKGSSTGAFGAPKTYPIG